MLGVVALGSHLWRPGRWPVEPFRFLVAPGLAGVLGSRMTWVLMPHQREYMVLRPNALGESLPRLVAAIPSYSVAALALECLGLALLGAVAWRAGRRSGRRWTALDGLAVVILGGAAASWGAVLTTGVFLDVYSFRYLLLPLAFASLGAVAVLARVSEGPRGLRIGAAASLGLAAAGAVALHPGRWGSLGLEARRDDAGRALSRCVAELAEKEESPTVLGEYWSAKNTTLYAEGRIRVLQLNEEFTGVSSWITNHGWICSSSPPGLVISKGVPEGALRAMGKPDEVVECPGSEVLVYRGEHRGALEALVAPERQRCAR